MLCGCRPAHTFCHKAGCFGCLQMHAVLAIWPSWCCEGLKSCGGGQVEESEKDAFRKTMPIYRQ